MSTDPKLEIRSAQVNDSQYLAVLAQQVFASTYGAFLSVETLNAHLEHQLSETIFIVTHGKGAATFYFC